MLMNGQVSVRNYEIGSDIGIAAEDVGEYETKKD